MPQFPTATVGSEVDCKSKNAMVGSPAFVPSLGKKHFDENEFEKIENVPVFDEHPGSDEDLDMDFTPEVLQQIIDRCNQRIKDTDDFPVVTDGHTSDEEPNPPVLGYACNFRLADFGKIKTRKAIYCDLMIRKDKFERAKELPRRSIELWVDDLTADNVRLEKARSPIDTVSLLGATRPARDLGMMFRKKTSGKVKYELERGAMALDNNDLQQIIEAVMQLPALKYIEEQMNKQGEPAKEEYEEEEKKDEDKKPDEEKFEEKDEEKEEKFEDEEEGEEVGKEKLRMQRDQAKRKYAKLESDYKALYSKVAELERKERRADRRARLMQLEAEGFVFDLAEELELVQDYEPARFSKHVSLIKKNYRKAPIGVKLNPAPIPEEGGTLTPASKSPREAMLDGHKRAQEKYSRSN